MRISIYIFMTLFLTSCFGIAPQKTGKEGQIMPNFNILLAKNTILSSRDIPTGKPIVLFYFSPYCPYCNQQTRDIVRDMDQFSDVQFFFITSYKLNQLEEFKKNFNLAKYTNVKIGEDTGRFVYKYFGAEGFPYIAIYSKNKTLNKAFLGTLSISQLSRSLDE